MIKGIGLSSRNTQTSWYGRTDGANPSQERMSELARTDNGVRKKMGLPAVTAGPSFIARLAGAVPHFDEETPAGPNAQKPVQDDAEGEKRSAPNEASELCPHRSPSGVNGGMPCVPASAPDKGKSVRVLKLANFFGMKMTCHGAPNMNVSSVFEVSNRTLFFPVGFELDILTSEIVLSFQNNSGHLIVSPCGAQKLREHWCNISGLIGGAETPEFLEPDYLAPSENGTVAVLLGQAELEQLRPALQDPRIVDYLWCELTRNVQNISTLNRTFTGLQERDQLTAWLTTHHCWDLSPLNGTPYPQQLLTLSILRLMKENCMQREAATPTPTPLKTTAATAPVPSLPSAPTALTHLEDCYQRPSKKDIDQCVDGIIEQFIAELRGQFPNPNLPTPTPASTPQPEPAGIGNSAPSPASSLPPSGLSVPEPLSAATPSTVNPTPQAAPQGLEKASVPGLQPDASPTEAAPQAKPEPVSAPNPTAPNELPETAIAAIAVMAIIVGVPSILIAISALRQHLAKRGATDAVTEVPLESLKVA